MLWTDSPVTFLATEWPTTWHVVVAITGFDDTDRVSLPVVLSESFIYSYRPCSAVNFSVGPVGVVHM